MSTPTVVTSYHEAAHSVIGSKFGFQTRKIDLNDNGSGRVYFKRSRDDPEKVIMTLMAGAAAELVMLRKGYDTLACDEDRTQWRSAAERLPADKRQDWEERLWVETCKLVHQHRAAIEHLAVSLQIDHELAKQLTGA